MKNKNWFEVSKEGLKQLQAGKSKDFVVRELIQNAWDEEITSCHLHVSRCGNKLVDITMEDDSPEGFRDITHAFTLFAPTYKRNIPEKRGRFNIGEKQVLAICEKAIVSTTKGTVVFDSQGRTSKRLRRTKGSIISLRLQMNKSECEAMLESIKLYLPPKGISFYVNGDFVSYKKPHKKFEAVLLTEIQKEDRMIRSYRKAEIWLHKADTDAYLYEMGLPVCKINCPYHVDVQQKIPMSIDRNKVSQGYLQNVFTLVLNEVHEDVSSEKSSETWIREATSNKWVSEEAVRSVVKSRYGNKVVVAAPGDKRSIDEALSHGYKVVYGNELSSAEWENIRKAEAIRSSSAAFPTSIATDAETVERDANMDKVAVLAKKIAKRCLGIEVNVAFASWSSVYAAQYGQRILTFNVKRLGKQFFDPPLSAKVIDLVLHELAHEKGFHTETAYHECLTRMAGNLIMTALKEPKFFEEIG